MDQQPNTTATLGTSALKAAVTRYYKALKNFESQEVDYEMGLSYGGCDRLCHGDSSFLMINNFSFPLGMRLHPRFGKLFGTCPTHATPLGPSGNKLTRILLSVQPHYLVVELKNVVKLSSNDCVSTV